MEEIQKQRLHTLQLIGDTTIIMQKVEALFKACLILLYGHKEANPALQQALKLEKKTLGGLIKGLKNSISLPENYEQTLMDLLSQRNIFVHQLFLMPWFNLSSNEGLSAINDFCLSLLKDARQCIGIFISFTARSPLGTEMNEEDRDAFNTIFDRIVLTATSDFGGRTFEEYLSDFKLEIQAIQNT